MTNKNHGWLWYFGGVLALAILAMVVIGWYNFALQLKPETLEKAQSLWNENGPKDYLLAYTISTQSKAGPGLTHYLVKVKGGRAYEAQVDGIPQPPERLKYYGMPMLFDYIDTFLEKDA